MSDGDSPEEQQEPTELTRGDPTDDATQAGEPGGQRAPTGETRRLGDFDLLREIGRGGMGAVYEARQISLNRIVALKVLPAGLGLTEQAVQRFEREAQAAAKLHHTNIVPVHAIGQAEGNHFYAMELIEGQSLSDVLGDLSGRRSNPLMEETVTMLGETQQDTGRPVSGQPDSDVTSLSDAQSGSRKWFDAVAKLVADVAEALDYAHSRGVVHRDIKPANLMLSKDGRLCVTDFGLALVTQEPRMTVTGSMMGTPAYMSPEQIKVGRMKLDHRTDVYSLGAVLYEMLALQRPFPAESREEILNGILTKEPRQPRRINPRVPVELETIALKALEKEPDQRYQTAGDLAHDLRQHLAGGLITARRASLPQRALKWMRRHPVATLATAGAIALAVVGTIAVQQGFGRSQETARRLVGSAEMHVRDGKYRAGLETVDRALAIAPDLFEAKKTKGRLLLGARRDRELASLATELLEDHPDDWEAHGWLVFAGSYGDLLDISAEEHAQAVARLAPDSAEAWYLKGTIASSDWEKVRCFDRALELDPGHAWALLQRGLAQLALHDYSATIADYERAMSVRPKSPRPHRFLAGFYRRVHHDAKRALEEYDKAIAMDPENDGSYLERSHLYDSLLEEPEKTLEDLTRAAQLAPWSAKTVARRSDALRRLGRFEEALAEAHRAVEIEPYILNGHLAILESLSKLERPDELWDAVEDFRRRIDGWASKKAAAAGYRGLSWFDKWSLGDRDQAVADASRAIELDPENFLGYIFRLDVGGADDQACDLIAGLDLDQPEKLLDRANRLYHSCHRPEPAIADYAKAIEMAPEWAEAFRQRGSGLAGEKRFAEAIADLDRAIELDPTNLDGYATRLEVHRSEKGMAGIEEDCNLIEGLDIESPRCLLRRADLMRDTCRRLDLALEFYDQCIERDPEWIQAYRNRGHLHREREDFELALQDYEKVIELRPGHLDALYNRAQTYMNLERYEEALVAFDRVFEAGDGSNGRWEQARVQLFLGREQEALATVEYLVGKWPNEGDSFSRQAQMFFWLGRVDDALEAIDRGMEKHPDYDFHVWRVILSSFREGTCDAIEADMRKQREKYPNPNPQWRAFLHVVYLHGACPELYDPATALTDAARAVELDAGDGSNQNTLGLAFYRNERYDEARDALLKAMDIRTEEQSEFLFSLAMTYKKLGEQQVARDYYDRAVARMNATYPKSPTLLRFKEEATSVLSLTE